MSKRDRIAATLDEVAVLRTEPDAALATAALRDHLTSKSNLVVAKASQITSERAFASLAADLTNAFPRFLDPAPKVDPACVAKTAIVAACVELNVGSADLFRSAIRHVQMEGSFGPPVDTAARMRGHAAFGLLNVRAVDAFRLIAELLADRWPEARHAAIRALGSARHETSAALLRMAARVYATDADTLGEVFSNLVAVDPELSFDFIAEFLNSTANNVAEVAALAVGESRHPRAIETLLANWRRPTMRVEPRLLCAALAITRRPEAVEFLIELARDGQTNESRAAADALQSTLRNDTAIQARVAAALARRGGG